MTKYSYVYILANDKNGTLYIGVTSNLSKRVWEHKNKIFKGFTDKYGITKLVYYIVFEDIKEAIKREKQIKKWNRKWKLRVIEEMNPNWNDLYDTLMEF
jgi:putative endonuclease